MAYTTATLLSKDPQPGGIRLIVEFTGNAGEPPVRDTYLVTGSTTMAAIRQWAFAKAADLNPARTVANNLTEGQTITLTAPAAPTGPSPKQVWLEKVNRYLSFREVGLTGAGATALQALLTDINATYADGFLNA